MIGFINILKSPGYTSSDIVVIVRAILSKKLGYKIKTGHLGTLDPGAAGVLPIAVGNATRLFDIMSEKKKTYIATFCFNKTSSTLDSYSEIIDSNEEKLINIQDINVALTKLKGEIAQIPPKYSAKSVDGRRAYDLARENKDFELKPRKVTIYGYDNVQLDGNVLSLQIECSSGTYIRSICRDLANELGTVGYMSSLIRIKSGSFNVNDSVTIKEFEENPMIYVQDVLSHLDLQKINIEDELDMKRLSNGLDIPYDIKEGTYPILFNNELFAIGSVNESRLKCRFRL